MFISSFVLDQVVNSARQSVQFFIISKKHEEIGHRINKDLHRGVTFIDGVGCYTGAGVKMMFVLAKNVSLLLYSFDKRYRSECICITKCCHWCIGEGLIE